MTEKKEVFLCIRKLYAISMLIVKIVFFIIFRNTVSLYPSSSKGVSGFSGYYDGPYTYPNEYTYTVTFYNQTFNIDNSFFTYKDNQGTYLGSTATIDYTIILLTVCLSLNIFLVIVNTFKDYVETYDEKAYIWQVTALSFIFGLGIIIASVKDYYDNWDKLENTLQYWNTCNNDIFAPYYNNSYFGEYTLHYDPIYTTTCSQLKVYDDHVCVDMSHLNDLSVQLTGRKYTDYVVQINVLARVFPMIYNQARINTVASTISILDAIINPLRWCH
jgi:hypothetical protein